MKSSITSPGKSVSNLPRIHLLFGFLGAGKTTLVRNLLQTADPEIPTAVIVNEFGAVGVDGDIIKGKSIDTIELVSGCICCTLRGSLLSAIEELINENGAKRIIVEATGVADPDDMLDDFEEPEVRDLFDVAPVVTVVDASNFEKIRTMLGEFYESQVINSDIVILNKVDVTQDETLKSVTRQVRQLNDVAEVRFADHCDIESSLIFSNLSSQLIADHADSSPGNGHDHAHHHSHDHSHEHAHEIMDSLVLQPHSEFSEPEFRNTCDSLPDRIWRMKGYMLLDGKPVLIQYATGNLQIEESETRDHYRLVVIGEDLDARLLETKFGRIIAAANE